MGKENILEDYLCRWTWPNSDDSVPDLKKADVSASVEKDPTFSEHNYESASGGSGSLSLVQKNSSDEYVSSAKGLVKDHKDHLMCGLQLSPTLSSKGWERCRSGHQRLPHSHKL